MLSTPRVALPGRYGAAFIYLALLAPTAVHAQRSRSAPEFTRQGVLVSPFAVSHGTDAELARRVGESLRSRLEDLLPRRETEVVRNDSVRAKLERAGFPVDSLTSLGTLRQLSRSLRADEIVVGTVARGTDGFTLTAELVLSRDARMKQPLPPATAPGLDDATRALARTIAAARGQLVYQRRCENFLREQRPSEAARVAREGVAAHPGGALVRTCLTQALRYGGAPAAQLLEAANGVLALDPTSAHALEAAGMALDSLHRRAEAADAWKRLFATDTSNLELGERVPWAMYENGNAESAEPVVLKLTGSYPDLIRIFQLQWFVANANRHWKLAISTGESLMVMDPAAARDSNFVARLATVYELDGQRYQAVATAARGVAAIPDAAQLYGLYTRLVRLEADSVLPRGLALFPGSAELLAMNATELREQGKLVEALAATRRAVAVDPMLPEGELSIAQAEFDLGRPDSALATLRRARDRASGVAPSASLPRATAPTLQDGVAWVPSTLRGADGAVEPPFRDSAWAPATAAAQDRDSVLATLARFALAKGNTLLRAADATGHDDAFELALGYLALADSLNHTPQSSFLAGTAALGAANSLVTRAAADRASGGGGCGALASSVPLLELARRMLEAGREISPEAVGQYEAYLDRLDAFVKGADGSSCPGGGTPG